MSGRQRLLEDSQLVEDGFQSPFAQRAVLIRPGKLYVQGPLEPELHEVSEDPLKVDLSVPNGHMSVEDQVVVAHVSADDPVGKGVHEGLRSPGQEARMGNVQGETEVLRGDRVKDPRQLFDGDTEISDLRLLVDLVHILDSDGEPVLLRELDDGCVVFNQAVEDVIHEKAEMVPEMEDDVFGLQLVGELHIVDQVLHNGLADGRLDFGPRSRRRQSGGRT